jgi:asparagine synthase (glutamine-hydrolysing)
LSGIVAIVHLNAAPVDRSLLESLTGVMACRGPDALGVWCEGSVGLGHAMLRTTPESAPETQPTCLAERLWVTGDTRLDERFELIRRLRSSGRDVDNATTDPELILHSYDLWAEKCVDFLRGDFAFALWDKRAQSMFCARDHFGIKPLYFTTGARVFLVSNTLNCIRRHPDVSGDLNENAIGDFLLFGVKSDPAATTFRDIHRLPPAHIGTLSPHGWSARRYWSPPVDGRIRHPRPGDYVEQFRGLLNKAVADRVRGEKASIFLSGGLDSSSVAVAAQNPASADTQPDRLRAYTFVYERLISDVEKSYAQDVAEFLKIPIQFLALDDAELFDRWDDPSCTPPEPVDGPCFAAHLDVCRVVSEAGRVALSGEGADNLMHFQMWPHLRDRSRAGEVRGALMDIARFLRVRKFPWRGVRHRVRRAFGKAEESAEIPKWISPDFERRVELRSRRRLANRTPLMPGRHAVHPDGYESLGLPQWTSMFELNDAGVTRQPLEVRYPFLDLRVVEYLLGIPPFPWCFDKTLLRDSLRGRVPDRIRLRPKTPLASDPLQARSLETWSKRLDGLPWSEESSNYMGRSLLADTRGSMDSRQIESTARAYCLNLWLLSRSRSPR